MDCMTQCEYCQSFPDGYFCIHKDSVIRDSSGKFLQARDCFYAFLDDWDETWLAHPCPFF